jgi:hypothetical protein
LDTSIFLAILAMPPLSHGKETYSSYFRDWTLEQVKQFLAGSEALDFGG